MKQIFLKVYPNGKTTTNASVLNFDRENNSGEIVIDYSEVDYLDWDKQLDLIFSDGSTAFVVGTGNILTVPLLESYLKKGSMTVQPIAKRLVGGEYEKAKWQVVALSVRDSLNVLENDVTVTVSVAEQMQAEIDEFKDALAELDTKKVNKVAGKGLSTNDYTTIEKSKVANLPDDTNAQLAETGQRINNIIVTPAEGITEQEILDARQGKASLRDNIAEKATLEQLNSLVISSGKTTIIVDDLSTNVLDVAMGIATVDIKWGTTHFEGSKDGGLTYQTLQVMNVETGTVFSRLDMSGSYCIDLRGVTNLKYIVDFSSGGLIHSPATIDVFNVYSPFFNISVQKPNKYYAPESLITANPVQLTSNRALDYFDIKTGTIYAHNGPNISKSSDYGVTWIPVISNPVTPWGITTLNDGAVRKLHNGKLFVLIKDNAGFTQMYLSDANESNFVLVNSFPKEGILNSGFGLSIYQDIILFAPYKIQPRLSTDTLRVHFSKDGGLTWTTIHTAPSIATWHYHDVAYDPYSNRIWLTQGDNYNLANVLYTDDLGVTWEKLWADGNSKTQVCSIGIMPDCVVFGTDQVGYQGAYIWYRNSSNNNIYEPSYSRGAPGRPGDNSYRHGQYWDTGNVIYYASKNPTAIIGTKDGIKYYQIWVTQDPAVSAYGVYGVDINNKLIAFTSAGAIIVDAPVWSEI